MGPSPLIYAMAQSFFRLLFAIRFRLKVEGAESLPATGPLILCANHRSNWDPPLVGTASRRMLYFMAKEELFRNSLSKAIMELVGAFSIRRGQADLKALKMALTILKGKKFLGIFPEGSRSRDGSLGEGFNGAASLALKTGTSVVPVAISGHYDRRGLRIRFGVPIFFPAQAHPEKAAVAAATEEIMGAIRRLGAN